MVLMLRSTLLLGRPNQGVRGWQEMGKDVWWRYHKQRDNLEDLGVNGTIMFL